MRAGSARGLTPDFRHLSPIARGRYTARNGGDARSDGRKTLDAALGLQYSALAAIDLAALARDLVERFGWWGVFVAMVAQGASLPVANELTMTLAGWFLIQNVGRSPWYILYAGFVGAAGWVVGALVAYAVMAYGGGKLLHRWRARSERLDRAVGISETWFARWGIWAVFICRLLPLGRTIITLPAGAARVPVVPFAVATFAGAFLWSSFLAALGYLAGGQWERVQTQLGRWTLPVVVAAAVVLIGAYVVTRWRRGRQ